MSDQETHMLKIEAAIQAGQSLAITPQVYRLFNTVSRICEDVGCACLAQRFRSAGVSPPDQPQQCALMLTDGFPTVHLLVKLAPLTRALAAGGYYDLALITTELALSFESTLDLDIGRAYLLLLLGENDEAWRIYDTVMERHGTLPAVELERLEALAHCHPSEEDIAELYVKLAAGCCCKQSKPAEAGIERR